MNESNNEKMAEATEIDEPKPEVVDSEKEKSESNDAISPSTNESKNKTRKRGKRAGDSDFPDKNVHEKKIKLVEDENKQNEKGVDITPSGIQGTHPSHGLQAGTVLTFGMGDNDQLGYDASERARPKAVPDIATERFLQVCSGGLHTACVSVEGKVYTFGVNDEGALGRDGAEAEPLLMHGPVAEERVVQVSCGDSHTASLCDDGKIFATGIFRDSNGKLGFSSVYGAHQMVTISELVHQPISTKHDPVIRIASGVDHVLALTRKGNILSWGCGEQGRLGRIGVRTSSRRKLDLQLTPDVVKILFPRKTSQAGKKVVDVACGAYHSFAIMADGSVYAWGASMSGQTGLIGARNVFLPEKVDLLVGKKIVAMAGGNHHSLALDDTGKVWSTGKGTSGVLGTGREEHSLMGDDEDAMNRWFEVEATWGDKAVRSVSCGGETSYAVTSDGNAYAWGFGENLQLGSGSEDANLVPKLIEGKSLEGHRVLSVSAGGQHVAILASQ